MARTPLSTPPPLKRMRPVVESSESEMERRYAVVRDSREKAGHGWSFAAGPTCAGTVVRKMDTGDYSLEGFEDVVTVDRKGSAVEFVGNIYQKRFERELERMSTFAYAAVVLEFDFEELRMWHKTHPKIRKAPNHWKTPGAILAQFWKIQLRFPHVHFIFAGSYGKDAVASLFKRVIEKHGRRKKS